MGWRAKHRRFARRRLCDPHCARCWAIAHVQPVPGQLYRVARGDTLISVVRAAYPGASTGARLRLALSMSKEALYPLGGRFGALVVPTEREAIRAQHLADEALLAVVRSG